MTRRKVTDEDLEERTKRAGILRSFMKDHLFTEVRLAELIGISRRTVQMMRSGSVTPHKDTLRRLDTLMQRHKHKKN